MIEGSRWCWNKIIIIIVSLSFQLSLLSLSCLLMICEAKEQRRKWKCWEREIRQECMRWRTRIHTAWIFWLSLSLPVSLPQKEAFGWIYIHIESAWINCLCMKKREKKTEMSFMWLLLIIMRRSSSWSSSLKLHFSDCIEVLFHRTCLSIPMNSSSCVSFTSFVTHSIEWLKKRVNVQWLKYVKH